MKLTGNRNAVPVIAGLVAGLLLPGAALLAQNVPESSGQPARAVRLSYVDGQVKLAQGNQALADKAVANTPLFEGAQVVTADDGKAEIQFEDGSVVRVAPDSSVTLTVLRGAGATADAEIAVNAGLAYFEFQGGGQAGQMSVHFGPAVATASGYSVLRVSVDTPPGSVAVFSGNVHVDISGSSGPVEADLHGGENLALSPADPSQYSLAESIEPNSWDAWNSDRDEALTAEAAQETGAPANLGQSQNPAWSDLDANGSWYDVPDQGYVWSPYDASNPGFDPYGNGAWTFTPGYGYIWASGYSWGYLPFQCGAWNFYNGFGWGWAPGMGGCNPWWGVGFYGGPNLGILPVGYPPITRPLPPHGPIHLRPVPVIPVSRHMAFANNSFPARDKNAEVTIEGSTVQAFRPLASFPANPRQAFASEGNRSEGNRTQPGNSGAASSAYPRPVYNGSRTAGQTATPPAYAPPHPAPSPRYNPPPAPRSYPGAGAPRPGYSSGGGAAPHPSGGGGGGGASHTGGHR
jgi:hypothetical protein